MPARLAYSPKVYGYTKDSSGTTYNLTPWITSGQVQRLVNQASTATLTLRNPYKQFTTPRDGTVAFHPMDPITIYMERIAGFPVRVFTGYLDQTPYYQLYPGTITLTATCTLKRLKYAWFDPALPYLMAFFSRYGWQRWGNTSIVNPHTLPGGPQKLENVQLQDASFGKLLWATLFEIGDWQDTEIYIEELPDGITQRMVQLMSSLQADQAIASSDFNAFMKAIIGTSSYGQSPNAIPKTNVGNLVPGKKYTVTASFYGGGGQGSCGTSLGMTFAELTGDKYTQYTPSQVTQSTATALGGLPCGTQLNVTYKGKTVMVTKADIGLGGPGLNNHPRAIDLYVNAWDALGIPQSAGTVLVDLEVAGTATKSSTGLHTNTTGPRPLTPPPTTKTQKGHKK